MFYQDWFAPRRRRVGAGFLPGPEGLESRRFLAAGVAECLPVPAAVAIGSGVSDEATNAEIDLDRGEDRQGRPAGPKAAKPILNVAGQWTIVTHADGFDVNGILNLQQQGKRITGTLTNDEQPAQTFKGRVKSTTESGGTVAGRTTNLALWSTPIQYEMRVIGTNHQTVFHPRTGDVNADGHKIA